MCAGDAIYPEVVSCEKRLCPVHPRRKRAVKSSFHYRKAVAPLKPEIVVAGDLAAAGFHYRKAVAPLKQRGSATAAWPPASFPLPKGGGPIEAAASTLPWSSPTSCFHYRKAVAPLKRVVVIRIREGSW